MKERVSLVQDDMSHVMQFIDSSRNEFAHNSETTDQHINVSYRWISHKFCRFTPGYDLDINVKILGQPSCFPL